MGSKRRILNRSKSGHLRPEIVAAWMAGDIAALQFALRLSPWEPSPFPYEIAGPLGCDEDDAPPDNPEDRKSLARSLSWQRKLLAAVGWPDCRPQYEKNLVRAQKIAVGIIYPESQDAALAEVEYRRQVLDEFDATRAKWAPAT
jgi:hypothetical protein